MSSENPINLGFHWEDPTEPNPPLGPNLFTTSPNFLSDYAVHNFSLPSAQPANDAEFSVLDRTLDATRPYNTNWSHYENYNPSSRYDCDNVSYNMELAPRTRMNSMASSASSQSYSLMDDQKIYFDNTQQPAPEVFSTCNTSYPPPYQSNYETVYSSRCDTQIAPQPHSMYHNPAHQGGHGLASSRSFAGHPEVYTQNFGKNFRAKTPAHNLDRPYKCDNCGASFSRNHDLKRHARIHLETKPFPCSFCDKAFARKDALKRHILVKRCSQSAPRDRQKLSQSPKALAAKSTGEQRPSLTHHRSSSSDNQTSPIGVSGSTGTRTPAGINEIKLQNIKCSMPTFI